MESLTFITVYCPNGKSVDHPDFSRKLDWFTSLSAYLQSSLSPSDSIVLCGDFNICPEPIDSWNEAGLKGTIFHTDQERRLFQDLLDWGLSDLFRQKYPEDQRFSWWDYRAGAFHRNQGLRIDFLLSTAAVLERCMRVEIDRDYRKKKEGLTASDHAPVFADLEIF
jgi:exodeoxyribonuclease-3